MTRVVLVSLLLISVLGCSSKSPFELAQDGPTMKENYDSHMSGSAVRVSGEIISRPLENDINYSYAVKRAFKRVANPELEMYVYPHRATRHGVVVPGYSVNFPMYEKVQYSLLEDVADVK